MGLLKGFPTKSCVFEIRSYVLQLATRLDLGALGRWGCLRSLRWSVHFGHGLVLSQVDIEPALVPLPSPVLHLATSLSSVSRANGAWKYFFSVIGDTDCISSFPPAIHLISPVTSFETGLGLLVRLQVDVASDAGRSSQRRQEPIYPSTQACSILNAEITFSVNLPL